MSQVYIWLTREQISLLADDKKSSKDKKRVIQRIEAGKFNLPNVVVSHEENVQHLEYLKQLDKASKGSSLWYNKSKDFIDD